MNKTYRELQTELKGYFYDCENENVQNYFKDMDITTPDLLKDNLVFDIQNSTAVKFDENGEPDSSEWDNMVTIYAKLLEMPRLDLITFSYGDGGKVLSVDALKDYISDIKDLLKD